MKSATFVILILFSFATVFSQKKTARDIDQRVEIEKLKKEIFALPVDKSIDTVAKYQLIFEQTGGWGVDVYDKNFSKRINSYGIRVKHFSYSMEDGTKISSGAEIKKGMFSAVDRQLIKKIKKNRFKDNDFKAIVSFGGEYLIKVLPIRYVGNLISYGDVTYQYYKKLKN